MKKVPGINITDEYIEYGPGKVPWDLVIMGAGPVGLTAAKFAVAHNLTTLIIEQGSFCGTEMRAETIKNDPFLDRIWGDNFIDNISTNITTANIWHSPKDKYVYTQTIAAVRSFEWPVLIQNMIGRINTQLAILDRKNLYISFDTSVKKACLSKKFGVKSVVSCVETTKGIIQGKAFLDCTGWRTPIGKQLGLDYTKMNNPMVKSRCSNFPTNKYGTFHAYYIEAGAAKSVDSSPPAIIVVFPGKCGHAEISCQFFSEFGTHGRRTLGEPVLTDEYLFSIWNDFKKMIPSFTEMIKNVIFETEFVTHIPVQSFVKKAMVYPGLILAGDAGGFTDPRTSAGLITSFKGVEFWVNEIAVQIKNGLGKWNFFSRLKANFRFKKSDIFKEVDKYHRQVNNRKHIAYGLWVTAFCINLGWNIITRGYRRIEKTWTMKLSDADFLALDPEERAGIVNVIAAGNLFGNKAAKKCVHFVKLSFQDQTTWSIFKEMIEKELLFKLVDKPKYKNQLINYFDFKLK